MTAAPKYYFFDCGVLNALRNELNVPLRTGTYRYGKLFETMVINQIAAINHYRRTDFNLYFCSKGDKLAFTKHQENMSGILFVEI